MKFQKCIDSVNRVELDGILIKCFFEYSKRKLMYDSLSNKGINDMNCFFDCCVFCACCKTVDDVIEAITPLMLSSKSFCYELVYDWLLEASERIYAYNQESEDK